MPEATYAHGVCVLDGLIYVMGGENSASDGSQFSILSSVYRFDPVSNSWGEVAPLSYERSELGVFVLGGSIYVVGGWDGGIKLNLMERYSVASDSWSEVNGGELGLARSVLGAHVMHLEVDIFASLIAKAKQAKQAKR
jgi:N-acetylneuraminic acid mutarotase